MEISHVAMRAALASIVILAATWVEPAVGAFGKTPEEQRAEIQDMRKEVLARLFEEEPQTKEMIDKAAGYAVFSNRGLNFGVVSSGNGKGVARDRRSNQDIYMKMMSLGGGLGLGVKTFSAVFIFHNGAAFDQFVNEGWDLSGQADVAATTDGENKAELGAVDESVALMEGVSVYQLTDKGLALQATLQGTKYWQAEDWN